MKRAITEFIVTAGLVLGLAHSSSAALTAERVYLSGTGPSDAIEWDFLCSSGRKSGEWTKIPVPSSWEQEGFGGYNYGLEDPEIKFDETGTYRTTFVMPEAWKEQHVRLVFEGSMTETSIKINGETVGTPNLGGYTEFRYILDETNVKYGQENSLEVLVKKKPDNHSLDLAERKADYWVFGGIYRPVYLEVQAKEFVNRVAIDAKADGTFNMDVFPQIHRYAKFREDITVTADTVTAQIETREGVAVGTPVSAPFLGGSARIHLQTKVKHPAIWSPEYPNLYQVRVTLWNADKAVSEKVDTFGFRTFEFKPHDGLYLNGNKIRIRGVNRNVFDPDTGRAVDGDKEWSEARAIKAMNANLVRSHMPPTTTFMQACDELGLLVISELNNWQKPVIDTPIGRNIAYEVVTKYQNHPSVIMWANGNESGFNHEIDELFYLYDLQHRPVIHPWAYFGGMDTLHYPKYDEHLSKLAKSNVYLPTEFMHGLYDGGHGAGMDDYWNAILKSPVGAGGVLWCWADSAIKRTDLNGKLDTYGNKSADGIVGPHGEKEASYYTVREIWAPVQIALKKLPAKFKGTLPVENRYYETSLNECELHWRLLQTSAPFSATASTTLLAEGQLNGPSVGPGKTGKIKLPLPKNWRTADALELTAFSRTGVEIMKWSWPVEHTAMATNERVAVVSAKGNPFDVQVGNTHWLFSAKTGQLLQSSVGDVALGLGTGPVLYAEAAAGVLEPAGDWVAKATTQNGNVVIESENSAAGSSFRWTLASDGKVTLDYNYAPIPEKLVYCAVGFDLDEQQVAGKRWLGQGPHRIWANRLKGPQFGLWENEYNDHITGQNWGEPEFKGIFGQVDWMQLKLKSGASLLLDPVAVASVGVLRPKNFDRFVNDGKKTNFLSGPVNAWWSYPEQGGLFLFHKLPAPGMKFAKSDRMGPQGEPSVLSGPITGRIVFQAR